MPANLTPQYREAEARYRAATTPQEKLDALREMLAIMPKHKGTEKLQADLKQRIAKLTNQQHGRGGPHRTTFDHVPREGAGQAVLLGPPNCGKSSLLAALTRAQPAIAAYPFTTQVPQPGMMAFEDVLIQLVDTPAIAVEHTPPWLPGLARSADIALVVVDLGEPALLDQIEFLIERLANSRVHLCPPESPASDDAAGAQLRSLVLGNKVDLPDAPVGEELLIQWLDGRLPLAPVSATTGQGLEELRKSLFDHLKLVRVYAKEPGKPADRERPFVLRQGATVADLAACIHRDLPAQLRFARVWGTHTFDGQTVHREHRLEDQDVLELHT